VPLGAGMSDEREFAVGVELVERVARKVLA
jgi:hypothetical protein